MRTRPAVLLAAVALSGLLALETAGPAAAHGDTIHFDITDRTGGAHPQTVASWENDGDPVTETLAATFSAQSADGRQLGPWRLVPVPGSPSTFSTVEALPAGRWKVTVESGFPALGRAEADVTVAAVIADPPVATATTAATAVRPRSSAGWIAPTAAATVLAAAAVVVLYRRRRAR